MTTNTPAHAHVPDADLDWQPEPLWAEWPRGPDNAFILTRMEEAFLHYASRGGPGRLLDLACGSAQHAPELARRGWDVVALEPSPVMIDKALSRAGEAGTPLEMFRAIGEIVPFRDASFDRVLCESSLDHFANPADGLREVARILKPEGEAVIGLVNYGGLSCRASRAVYTATRRLRPARREKHMFWDSPVPHEHTFETTLGRLKQLAKPGLRLEQVYGVSVLWGFPGWGPLLDKLPKSWSYNVLKTMDRGVRFVPGASDFLITRWRPTG
jgi:SAM-dependent methyltransferase